jgi:ribonuclease BN (tRNA processing enzyme)
MPGVKLDVYGSARKGGSLESILQGQMDYDYFPVDMNAFGAELTIHEMHDSVIQIGPLRIEWQEQVFHPGGCVRYSVTVNGRKVVYASDVELNKIFRPDEPTEELEQLGRQYIEFIKDAEILIADGQYTQDEYPKVVGWGHTTIPLIVEVAYAAGVKQLALFHHDPQRSDKMIDEFWKEWYPQYHDKTPPMNVFWAREGLTVPV